MCGILAILGMQDASTFRQRALELQKKIRHRGPDWSGITIKGNNILCHERLAIVDPESGDQPLFARDDDSLILVVNGEIYNHHELERSLSDEARKSLRTKGDCECFLHLYEKDGVDFLTKNEVCGMYGCAILDQKTNEFIIARDPIGIIPLYYGRGKDGSMWVSSEMKAMHQDCVTFDEFPPGHIYDSRTQQLVPFLTEMPSKKFEEFMAAKKNGCVANGTSNGTSSAASSAVVKKSPFFVADEKNVASYPKPNFGKQIELKELREGLEAAVKSHLMSDVPYGVLLSGGLDSSLIAGIMSKFCRKRIESDSTEEAFYPRLHSFCIGLKGSPDLAAAKKVADFLGTVHHPYEFTVQQGLDAIAEVIYHIETFDVTTIRASTPMFLMSRKIRASGVKMVLSGEGADEVFGGYLYFHKAPNAQEFHEETIRKCRQLSKYDCCRANKSTMAWSLEARVPFLDKRFLDLAFSFDPAQKMCVDPVTKEKRPEKYLLRKAFDCDSAIDGKPYLPKEVLWRQKEQFSDGVGYSWIDAIQEHAEKVITDQQLAQAKFRFPEKTPTTKEAYFYRDIFSKHFGERNENAIRCVAWQNSIACSSETALRWDASFQGRADASGRAVAGVHDAAYTQVFDRFKVEDGEGEPKPKKLKSSE